MPTYTPIDYWGIVNRALRIVWRHKILWFFGFFASMSGGTVFNWSRHGSPWVRDLLLMNLGLLALAVMAVVILWLVFFVMNIISVGGLIRGASNADRGGDVSFEGAWRAGLKAFWRLLGLTLLALLAFLIVTAACVIPIVVSAIAGPAGIAIAILIGAVLLLPYLAFVFGLAFTVIYAEREVVLADARLFDAIAAGWRLMSERLWQTFMVWLVMLLSGIAYTVGLVIVLLVVAIPFVIIGLTNLLAALVIGIPIGAAIVIVASGAYGTYSYAVWTLAYEDLKRGAPSAPVEAAIGQQRP
jgi:hypothetical protein